jgi:hypothetical protein
LKATKIWTKNAFAICLASFVEGPLARLYFGALEDLADEPPAVFFCFLELPPVPPVLDVRFIG